MGFKLNESEYFIDHGVNIMAFNDTYPEGHQSGVSLIMNDNRAFSNGDIRFEPTPGQWQPLPKQLSREVDSSNQTIKTTLAYPDIDRHLHGFNPIIYPDFEFNYDVTVTSIGNAVKVNVDLDREVKEEFLGRVCFNIELFPGALFGKSYIMDDNFGIFPRQANAPTISREPNIKHSGKMTPKSNAHAVLDLLAESDNGYNPIIADDILALPYAVGHELTVCPEDDLYRFTIKSNKEPLKLYDGRMNHNNGWFVVSCEVPANTTSNAIELIITPYVDNSFIKEPVVQVSQVGYHPNMPKTAIIELDINDNKYHEITLQRLNSDGFENVYSITPSQNWGHFLRYNYLTFDFSQIKDPGLYRVAYKNTASSVFRISEDIYERGVWQPVLEYFLPVQMCHMRVNEKYRVWHGLCHNDDARMAPINYEQFDGASQGESTYTKYKSGEHICGLNKGGWHDAGDFDLRIESQTGEMYILSSAYEEFDVYLDETTIDQDRQITEIHQPDGKNDILQQIEHGALSVINAYKKLGRIYHFIMSHHLRQYVLLGDPSTMTSGIPDNEDERYVFTKESPEKDYLSSAHLAGSYRALKGFNDELANDCINIAKALYENTGSKEAEVIVNAYDSYEFILPKTDINKLHALTELYLSTNEDVYKRAIIDKIDFIVKYIEQTGWMICRIIHMIDDEEFKSKFKTALIKLKDKMNTDSKETPYGIPYKPNVWGAGWDIQARGARYYYLYKAYPEIFTPEYMYHSLNFVLGVHPGSNTQSFASGVGTKSVTIGYGLNRADWSYIPGGVVSGTGLIRPDLPELLDFPYLWQQKEYVLGGGSSNYMFLVLAVRSILTK